MPAGEQVAESVVYRPPTMLQPYVESYVGYRYSGFAPGGHVGLPSRHLTFIVTFDAPLELSRLPDGNEQLTSFETLLGGLHTSPAVIRHDGSQHGLQLQVTPAGARGLFGLPAAELAGMVVPLDAIWGRLNSELLDRLDTAAGWNARFAVLDRVLLRRALGARGGKPVGGSPRDDGRVGAARPRRRDRSRSGTRTRRRSVGVAGT